MSTPSKLSDEELGTLRFILQFAWGGDRVFEHIDAQAARIKTLEAALEPLAKLVDVPSYDIEFHWDYELPRRAAAALKGSLSEDFPAKP